MAVLTSLMKRFCIGEDSWLARCSTSDPSTSKIKDGNGKSRHRKDKCRNKERSPKSTAVNAGFKSSRPNNKTLPLKDNSDELSNLNKILDRICQIHSTSGRPANHTNRNCWVFKQSRRLNAEHKGLGTDNDEPHQQSTRSQKTFPHEVKTVNSLHVIIRKYNMALTKTSAERSTPAEHRDWMSKPITFDHRDYSISIRNAGWTALILDPIIDGLRFTQVLMDGASDLNLLYPDTIRRMGIDPTTIRPSRASFKGVAPGPYARCTGSLLLEVMFGSPDNFR